MGAKLSGPGAGSRFNIAQNSEINVTPFVDVMLVLLIIFMVAASVAVIDVKVQLPNAVAPPSPNPSKPVFISLKPDSSVYIGNTPSDFSTLAEDLKKQTGGRDPTHERIFIRGDQNLLYGDFMKLMIKLQDNGYYSVALVGEDKAQ